MPLFWPRLEPSTSLEQPLRQRANMYEQSVLRTRHVLQDNIPNMIQTPSSSGQYCSTALRSLLWISRLKHSTFLQSLYENACAQCHEHTSLIYPFHHHHHHHHHWQNSPFWVITFISRFCQICLELDHPGFTSLHFATIFFLQSKVVSLASNPQPEWPRLFIRIPQWQGSPIIPPGTGFPFRCLIRLTGLRWRYSNPPPHGTPVSFTIYLTLIITQNSIKL
jgi:hypothetical protein